jgi:predicted PurR-regulated permease PerM
MRTDLRVNWLIAIALTGGLLYLLAPILTPFVAAALLAYVGDPVADSLQKLKLPRTLAVVAVFILTFLSLGLLVVLAGPLIRTQISALLDALPGIAAKVEQVWLPWIVRTLGRQLGRQGPDGCRGVGWRTCSGGHQPVPDSHSDFLSVT